MAAAATSDSLCAWWQARQHSKGNGAVDSLPTSSAATSAVSSGREGGAPSSSDQVGFRLRGLQAHQL